MTDRCILGVPPFSLPGRDSAPSFRLSILDKDTSGCGSIHASIHQSRSARPRPRPCPRACVQDGTGHHPSRLPLLYPVLKHARLILSIHPLFFPHILFYSILELCTLRSSSPALASLLSSSLLFSSQEQVRAYPSSPTARARALAGGDLRSGTVHPLARAGGFGFGFCQDLLASCL